VHELLDAATIEYWLFGGWGVDFHVGEPTREHDDIDIAVWHADLPRIVPLLERDGWIHAPEPDEDGGTGYERDGVRLELTFLARDEQGRIVTPLRGGNAAWSGDAFPGEIAQLGGVQARVVSIDALTRSKSSPRDDPDDAAKDDADFSRLAALRPQPPRP
jgi:hypothetical protein